MERIVHIAKDFEEAELWDIEQCLAMSPDERLEAAKVLKERVFGVNHPDLREFYRVSLC